MPNLFVYDGSVFVTSSGFNPTGTIAAIALRSVKDLIAGKSSGSEGGGMSSLLTAEQRGAFAGIADYLIPNAEGMPSASEVDVPGTIVDRVLALRTDLQEPFLRGINKCVGLPAAEAANALNRDDPAALAPSGSLLPPPIIFHRACANSSVTRAGEPARSRSRRHAALRSEWHAAAGDRPRTDL